MNSNYHLLLPLNLLSSEVFCFVLEKQKFGNVYRK